MTPYQEHFLPAFLVGCGLATVAAVVAGKMNGCLGQMLLLAFGILAFWIGMFVGVDEGYRAWQSMPDPPAEAFNDASAAGALFLGWLPATIFCLTIFAAVRIFRRLLRWANPDLDPAPNDRNFSAGDSSGGVGESSTDTRDKSTDPYQTPKVPVRRN